MLSATLTMAQSKISFGILGGVNFQNLNGKDADGDKLTNDMILGYHAGVNVQIPIAPQFYFQPGLLFSTKGAKNSTGSITSTTKLNYIEMPLNVVFKAELGSGYFMLGLGPYIGYGISGKVNTEGGSVSLKTDVKFKNVVETSDPITVSYYKALDAGGNIFAGYELASGIFAQLDTQFGMLKINPENKWITDDKSSVKNTGFGLSIGYRF
jgi:hypothetical protein